MGRLSARSAENILARVRSRLTDDDLADQITSVIKGETVTVRYAVARDPQTGEFKEIPREVIRTRTVQDQARGVMLAHKLGIVNLGLQQGVIESKDDSLYEQYTEPVDERIIARADK